MARGEITKKVFVFFTTKEEIEIPLEKFVVISSYLLFFYNTIFLSWWVHCT